MTPPLAKVSYEAVEPVADGRLGELAHFLSAGFVPKKGARHGHHKKRLISYDSKAS